MCGGTSGSPSTRRAPCELLRAQRPCRRRARAAGTAQSVSGWRCTPRGDRRDHPPTDSSTAEARGDRQPIGHLAPCGGGAPCFESKAGATPALARTLPSRPERASRGRAPTRSLLTEWSTAHPDRLTNSGSAPTRPGPPRPRTAALFTRGAPALIPDVTVRGYQRLEGSRSCATARTPSRRAMTSASATRTSSRGLLELIGAFRRQVRADHAGRYPDLSGCRRLGDTGRP
jgi:hypothetical protein